jgi:hypothetical protein
VNVPIASKKFAKTKVKNGITETEHADQDATGAQADRWSR